MTVITFLKFWKTYIVKLKIKSQFFCWLTIIYIRKLGAHTTYFTFLRMWESGLLLMSLANLCTEFWAKLGGEAHVRSEFRHVYITAQDISQSLAKLPKFPGSRESAEKRHKCSLFLLFLLLPWSGISVIVQLHLHCYILCYNLCNNWLCGSITFELFKPFFNYFWFVYFNKKSFYKTEIHLIKWVSSFINEFRDVNC